MKKLLCQLSVGLFVWAPCLPAVEAEENSPSLAVNDESCSQANLLSHFPSIFVGQTLQAFAIPESKREAILAELKSKEGEVIRRVEEKALQSKSNPLKDPEQRPQALQLFRQSLMEVFTEVLKSNGVSDDKTIEKMMQDLQ